MADITLWITDATAESADDTLLLIASHAPMMTSLQFCQINWNGRVMIVIYALNISAININPTVTIFPMVVNTPDTVDTILEIKEAIEEMMP